MFQNYVFIDKDFVFIFIEFFKVVYKDMFFNGVKVSFDFLCIVNKRYFYCIKKMLDDIQGKIVMGGELDESELYIEFMVVLVNFVNDLMMQEEFFGFIFFIYLVNILDEVFNIVNLIYKMFLLLFIFGNKVENNRSMCFFFYFLIMINS